MTPALVEAAAEAGASLYVTGQWRVWAESAVRDTRLEVFALGHDTWERWGVGELARRLRRRWPELEVHTGP